MNKRIFLIIIWVITIGVIIFTTSHSFKNFKSKWKNNTDWEYDDSDNQETATHISTELDSFSKIDVNCNIMEVVIKQGDNYSIKANVNKGKYMPSYKIDGNTLNVTQHISKGNNSNINAHLEITVPGGVELDTLEVSTNVGGVELRDIEVKDIELKTNVGEITLQKLKFDTLEAETNVGEIKLTVPDNLDDYDITARTDIGEVLYQNRGFKRNYKQNGRNGKKIKLTTNVGEIDIN